MTGLFPPDERPLLIGHRGLPGAAPENTLRSLALALDSGAGSFEVDVVALSDGTLVAGHSLDLSELCHGVDRGSGDGLALAELRRLDPELATLDEVLELTADRLAGRLAGRPFLVDLKCAGRESELISALSAHDLVRAALVCSLERPVLKRLHALAPDLALSVSYPADRHRVSERRLLAPSVSLALRVMRWALPHRIGRWLDETGARAVTLHHAVVSPSLVRACHARGIAAIAWTINDAALAEELTEIGIDAIITDDPRPLI